MRGDGCPRSAHLGASYSTPALAPVRVLRFPTSVVAVVVISVHMLGASADPAGYYLVERAGCPASDPSRYYLETDASPPTGRWIGAGAAAAGLVGPIDAAGADVLRGLLAGRAPDGSATARPVLRADPRGRL